MTPVFVVHKHTYYVLHLQLLFWPGDFVEVKVPDEESSGDVFAVEPHTDNDCNTPWLKLGGINSVGGTLRVCNARDVMTLMSLFF